MICKNCGREIPNDFKTCPICGADTGVIENDSPVGEEPDTIEIVEPIINSTDNDVVNNADSIEEDLVSDVAEELVENNRLTEESEIRNNSIDEADDLAHSEESSVEVEEDDDDMSKAFAEFEAQMNAPSEKSAETTTTDTINQEDASSFNGTDEQSKSTNEPGKESVDPDTKKDTGATGNNIGDKIKKAKDIGSKVTEKSRKTVPAEAITSLVKWDALILVLSIIWSALGGIGVAVLIGILAIAVLDFVLIQRARIGKSEDKGKGSNKRFVAIAVIALALTCVGSYLIAPANAAMRSIKAGDVDSAKATIESKIKGRNVQEKLFDSNVDRYYKSVVSDYKAGKIDAAEVKEMLYPLSEILDSKAGDKISALITSIDAYNQGKAFFDNKNYIDAISLLSKVVKDHPKYQDAQDMIEKAKETYKKDLFAKVGSPSNLDECVSALELLKDASEALKDDQEIIAKQDEIKTVYITLLDKEVNSKLADYDYEGANDLVNTAKKLVGDDAEIGKLQSLVNDSKPKTLSSFHIINEDNTFTDNDVVDTYGNEYDANNSLIIKVWSQRDTEAYATYNIGSESKHIRGTIAVGDDSEEDFDGTIHVLSNHGELFTQRVTRNSKPINIDLDVSDTDTLTFRIDGNEAFEIGYIIIGNMMVY